MKKFIYYLPRVLSILIIAFFAMFILEGLSPEFNWQDSLAHLVLALVVLLITIAAWKWPKIGGWFFFLFGLKYLLDVFDTEWLNGLIVGGIPLLTGILFLIEGFRKQKTV